MVNPGTKMSATAPLQNPVTPATWQINDLMRLRRFLSMGSEASTFCSQSEEKPPSRDKADCIQRLIEAGQGQEVVEQIVKFSAEGRAARQQPAIFALALCAKQSSDLKTKRSSFAALSDTCRVPTQIFQFVDFAEKLSDKSSGWGRAQRNAISDWYNRKEAKDLAVDVTKYRQRNGWSHVDLLRLAHVTPKNEVIAAILMYVSKGLKKAKVELEKKGNQSDGIQSVFDYLEAVETVKHSNDAQQVAGLVERHSLDKEQLPTWLLNSKEVWRALLQKLPLPAILRHLGKLTSLGLLDPLTSDSCAQLVIDKLRDEPLLRESRLHPFHLLLALEMYKKGEGEKGKKLKWVPNGAVVGALDKAFHEAFKNIEPTNKRYLLAVDVSGSMQYGCVNGAPQVTPAVAMAAMAMVTARTEQQYQMVAFSQQGMQTVNLNAQMSLQEVCHSVSEVKMGGTDCALPIQWAQTNKKNVDVFIVYTDCETWSGSVHPADTLRQYRKEMNIPEARLVVCALTSSHFSLADPQDAGMLDVAGFDAAAPLVIRSFIQGEL